MTFFNFLITYHTGYWSFLNIFAYVCDLPNFCLESFSASSSVKHNWSVYFLSNNECSTSHIDNLLVKYTHWTSQATTWYTNTPIYIYFSQKSLRICINLIIYCRKANKARLRWKAYCCSPYRENDKEHCTEFRT